MFLRETWQRGIIHSKDTETIFQLTEGSHPISTDAVHSVWDGHSNSCSQNARLADFKQLYVDADNPVSNLFNSIPVCGSYPAAPLALSVVVNDQKINECQYINEDCDISIAPSYKACIRNSFKICSADAQNRERQFLKYGQDFYLECLETDGLPLILYSSPKNVGTLDGGSNYTFKTHGEVHQTLGLTKRFHNCFEFAEMKVPESPSYCRWKCLHIQPNIRPETEGDSVPVISHPQFISLSLQYKFIFYFSFP